MAEPVRTGYDPDLYDEGMERVFRSCAAWLQGIRRHQIREVRFDALIAGKDFSFFVQALSDGRITGTATHRLNIVWTGEESRDGR